MWPPLNNSPFLHCSVIKSNDRAMELVTHLVNDSVEYYKWSLTIAGKQMFLISGFYTSLLWNIIIIKKENERWLWEVRHEYIFVSSRQEGGELAHDGVSLPHSGHQLPVPVLSVGRTNIHADSPAIHAQEDTYNLQLQYGGPQFLYSQRGQCHCVPHLDKGLWKQMTFFWG